MASSQPSSSTSTAGGKPDRLFVGNLAPNVDEYTLVQVFSKYGKITKLDVMYHKTGPLKGKSRGYAFIEYSSKDDALKALVKLHDRLLRGRKLVVTYANAAPPDDYMNPKGRRIGSDAAKPTTLSLLKAKNRPQTAEAQIAAMEAKLASMSKRSNRTPTPEPAGRAEADALEAEIMKELNAAASVDNKETSEGGSKGKEGSATRESSQARTRSPTKSSTPTSHHTPARSASPPAKRRRPEDDKSRTRREEFERGLAGLPKKPAFSS